MHVNGCHIVSTPCADNPEGFSSIVSRCRSERNDDDTTIDDSAEVRRGPFNSIQAAVKYAMSWNKIGNPPAIPSSLLETDQDAAIEPIQSTQNVVDAATPSQETIQ